MPQLLLELFSEEIPARMQKKAASDLERMVMDGLTKAGLLPGGTKSFSAPRRLTLVVEDLAARTADVREEKKGPKVGSPQPAIDGFLRGAGLTSFDQARIVSDPKKGDFYVADIKHDGQATTDLIASLIPEIISNFPWPKSMRWGEGALRWVRPLHSILCVFDGEIVPFEVGGIASGNVTEGHRFHGTGRFAVRDYDDYTEKLAKASVVLDRDERKAMILADARMLCAAQNLELVEDEGLAEEVTGLVDQPVVLMGQMDPAFLDLPPEVIRLTMRVNQKYFAVRDPATGGLAPRFIVVSNIAATDGGAKVVAGNARVLSARLNDARHFWDLDRKTPLEDRVGKLDTLVFHEKLGSVGDKVKRIVALAGEIAPLVGADVALAQRAALLAKADLTTGMVGEFPELQGVMGRYYAGARASSAQVGGALQARAPEHPSVANAIAEHYKPQGPSDAVPTDPVAIAVALADKIDTLTGFFAIGEKPTGSGDPYALRRAALGVIRIVRENQLALALASHVTAADLTAFILDRLRVMLRDESFSPDILDAVFAVPDDDVNRIVARVSALAGFVKTDDGANLVAGYKRGASLLDAEARKTKLSEILVPDIALMSHKSERDLFYQLDYLNGELLHRMDGADAFKTVDYELALKALADVRPYVDEFFNSVLVNAEQPQVRANRLALLLQFRSLVRKVADFDKLVG